MTNQSVQEVAAGEPPSRFAGRALAAAAILVLAAAGALPAFGQGDPLSNTTREQMEELMRKGEAREMENGYCATLPWPVRGSLQPFYAFLERGQPGGIYLAKLQTSNVRGCSYYRMDQIFTDAGKKCARTVGWACTEGDRCVVSRAIWCREPSGTWTWK